MTAGWKLGGGAAAAALALLVAVGPGLAQVQPWHRSPVQRQAIVHLAYVLGEAHALHRLCAGSGDATWYGRMERLEAQEASDEGFRRRLVDSFNAGFASRQVQFATCSRASQTAERRVAAHGGTLAREIAGPDDAP